MTANKPNTRKSKGRQFQKEIAELLRLRFGLEERDIVSTPASVIGEDLLLSEKAKQVFPYSCELKRVESLNIWSAIRQAEDNCKDRVPLVIFKRNHSKVYCVIEFDKLLNLLNNPY